MPPSSRASCASPIRSACRRWPRASRPPSRSPCCAPSPARRARATTSHGPPGPRPSRGCSPPRRPRPPPPLSAPPPAQRARQPPPQFPPPAPAARAAPLRRSAPVPAVAPAAAHALRAPDRRGLVDAGAHAAAGRRELRGLGRGDGQGHRALGDATDLGGIDEALAALGVDDDPVEDVLAPRLLGTAHGAHLDPVRRADRRPALEHLEGDRVAVVLCHCGPSWYALGSRPPP